MPNAKDCLCPQAIKNLTFKKNPRVALFQLGHGPRPRPKCSYVFNPTTAGNGKF
jgi:hypothetical protein